ncbi:hypothetical protein QFC24_000865 [Naganishia onofrii]|uniref:Uncharacterized protein n=1 Tax=Naganishia onofrii TaxID=1851511 RepID=A0ACC2XXE2_9TREE|nr:hypothetical protein QFC24_000865 [Naganishia onofrii]
MIQEHHRFHHAESKIAEDALWRDVDMKKMFPRIELLSVASQRHEPSRQPKDPAFMPDERNLNVVLFKPVTIDDLQLLRLQFHGNLKGGTVCMFGIQMVTSFSARSVGHITNMTVFPGAGIFVPSFAMMVNMQGHGLRFNRGGQAPGLSIHIQNPTDDMLTRSTISLVLGFARAGRYSGNLRSVSFADDPRLPSELALWCLSPVLKAFEEILALGDLPSTDLCILIEDDLVTRAIIQRHLEAIAETYSRSWYYQEIRNADGPFVTIEGCLTVPASLTQNLGYGRERIGIHTEGALWPDVQGFTAWILSETDFQMSNDPSDGGTWDELWEDIKAYPCHHVPVPEDW